MMQLGNQTWQQAQASLAKVVVLPLGSVEQHGHHLPLLTDSMIAQEIVCRTAPRLEDVALYLPVLWIGASHHHLAFPGTISASHSAYIELLVDVLDSLVSGGFKRIVLLNAHGGNADPAHIAMERIQRRYGAGQQELWIAFVSWVQIAHDKVADLPGMVQGYVSHACEIETSMILRVAPSLVDLDKAQAARPSFASKFYCPDDSKASRVSVARTFEQVSISGALGHPELATAEKGEAIFSVVADEVVEFIREFASWGLLSPS